MGLYKKKNGQKASKKQSFTKISIKKLLVFLIFILFTAETFSACEKKQGPEIQELEIFQNTHKEEQTINDPHNETKEAAVSEINTAEAVNADDMKKMFGENCITEQTFEITLSEYSGKVYFVPFAPSEDNQNFRMQIIQDGEVLTNIHAYVPDELSAEKFSSLDAVSFFDVNYDNNTDIVLIETYGNTSFAVVYYGFDTYADDYERYFVPQEQLSENITGQTAPLSVPAIRSYLSDGKKNGDFTSYQEAYKMVSRLCELENTGDLKYNLIFFDNDDIPELVAGVSGYYTSLYTYKNGTIYTLMDQWPYGAGGNTGYEYSKGKNSLRNYNTDYAGAILYTTYMAVRDQCTMDVVTQIVTYNFDDVNGNGIPDEEEMGSMGNYSISYMDGVEVTSEECAIYDTGGYEYIDVTMSLEDLEAKLNEE